jgi:hypothetical protein
LNSKIRISSQFKLIKINCDIEATINNWREKGVWELPFKKETFYYLIYAKESKLYLSKVSRVAAIIIQACGNLNLHEMLCLIDGLQDSQTIRLREEYSKECLLGWTLSFLREKIGISIMNIKVAS